jgi:hypothetical protein
VISFLRCLLAGLPPRSFLFDPPSLGDVVVLQGIGGNQQTLKLDDLREIEVVTTLVRHGEGSVTEVTYRLVFVDYFVDLSGSLGHILFDRLLMWNPWIPVLDRHQGEGPSIPFLDRDLGQGQGIRRPIYDNVGWDALLAATEELLPETQRWMRNDLTARQQPGQLLGAVVGNRPSEPHRDSELSALLVYPEVIVVTSGHETGETMHLRPRGSEVIDTVVRDEHLVEVTVLNMHIVDLEPLAQTTVALQALRSLPWIKIRETRADEGPWP